MNCSFWTQTVVITNVRVFVIGYEVIHKWQIVIQVPQVANLYL